MLNKKIKKLLIGTNNKGKLREIKGLLPKYIKTYSTAGFKLRSPKENGKTFEQMFCHFLLDFLKQNLK